MHIIIIGDWTHKPPKGCFHQDLKPCDMVHTSESWPTTLLFHVKSVIKKYIKKTKLFDPFFLCRSFSDHLMFFWHLFDRFVNWVIFNSYLLMYFCLIPWKVVFCQLLSDHFMSSLTCYWPLYYLSSFYFNVYPLMHLSIRYWKIAPIKSTDSQSIHDA